MKFVFMLFDSLNRHSLEPYGGTVSTPNFNRLAARSETFDNHYVGSLPCIPARRDLLTGRPSFLHRAWGPIEPFDDTFPDLLQSAGVWSHLVTDHFHYWADGGATYLNRYTTYDMIRGQEQDPWKAVVRPPLERFRAQYHASQYNGAPRSKYLNNMIAREYMHGPKDFPAQRCIDGAKEFFRTNASEEDWFLQIEVFEPHEPFHSPPGDGGASDNPDTVILDWPPYNRVTETPHEIEQLRSKYQRSIGYCDRLLGEVLDEFDKYNLWDDTALIVTTDHGYLLGEHGWWSKLIMPCYQEVVHIPLFLHLPNGESVPGSRRSDLTQTIDIMPTILDCFSVAEPPAVTGHSLRRDAARSAAGREAIIFGTFGAAINITDGRYTYFRYPVDLGDDNLFQYTLMPTFMRWFFSAEELSRTVLSEPFSFTKGMPVLKVPADTASVFYPVHGAVRQFDARTVLHDLDTDPRQLAPVDDLAQETRLMSLMVEIMKNLDAPREAFQRFGLLEKQ